jgi:ApbE superfamily uncharacterized protein (UPF0280 family)
LKEIKVVHSGMVLVSSGPLHMTVLASRKGRALSEEAIEGACYALEILKELVAFLPTIRRKSVSLEPRDNFPLVVNEMISATKLIDDPGFTPLAAVAGAAADMVADRLMKTKATRIIVDNGGDIAIRLREEETARVGLCLNIDNREIGHFVDVDCSCGICTSGFGGRSFTLGIADGVVAVSEKAAIADAAATRIANKTNLKSEKILREKAETIYPDTDIPGKLITVSVGNLTDLEIMRALFNGRKEAERLIKKKVIYGAALSLKDKVMSIGSFQDHVRS